MGEKLRDKFEKWYKRKNKRKYHYKLNNFVDGKYDNSFIQTSYVAYIAGWLASINTPKHETVEEWEQRTGESYGKDCPVWFKEECRIEEDTFMYFRLCTYEGAIPIGSEENVKKWMELNKNNFIVANHHGKPEIEG